MITYRIYSNNSPGAYLNFLLKAGGEGDGGGEGGTERTMDTRELICVFLERDALFMQEIVKLYPFGTKGRMALLGSL